MLGYDASRIKIPWQHYWLTREQAAPAAVFALIRESILEKGIYSDVRWHILGKDWVRCETMKLRKKRDG